MSKKENRIGEKHITNEGFQIEIIEYFGKENCTIQFEDKHIVENVRYINIKKGGVKNPYNKSVCGVGFFGQGKYKATVQYKKTEQYNRWCNMLERCYDKKFQEKYPTYKDCSVDKEWHNFQNFAEWYDENYIEGWHLDKDILLKGNKIYSLETCAFVPSEINSLFIKSNSSRGDYPIGVYKHKCGKYVAQMYQNNKPVHLGYYPTIKEAFEAYKTAKELWIKEVADKWRGQITEQVYQTLINCQVEITD